MYFRVWKLASVNPPINQTTALSLPVPSVCACDTERSWQLSPAELLGLRGSLCSCTMHYLRCHREAEGWGCGGKTTRAACCKGSGGSTRAASELPSLGRASCLQPWREAGVQEVAGERFSKGPVVWLLR